jgi:hypothetical protein
MVRERVLRNRKEKTDFEMRIPMPNQYSSCHPIKLMQEYWTQPNAKVDRRSICMSSASCVVFVAFQFLQFSSEELKSIADHTCTTAVGLALCRGLIARVN